MNILALSGSLQKVSSNTALLRAALRMAPEGALITLSDSPGLLPHFNPELDPAQGKVASPEAARFRAEVHAADAVIIATPEYAFGMPGFLKNALDWLVGSGDLYRKPTAIMSASPSALGGEKALAWLTQTLNAQGVLLTGTLNVPFIRKKIVDGEIADTETLAAIRELIQGLTQLRQ